MKTHELEKELAKHLPLGLWQEVCWRLARVEGSTPASGSPDRGAGRQPDAPLTSDSARPFAGQAERVLGALIDQWESQAALRMEQAARLTERRRWVGRAGARQEAAVYKECAWKLREALSEAQSGVEEGEPCAECNGRGKVIEHGWAEIKCPFCGGTGSRMERSGPANADV